MNNKYYKVLSPSTCCIPSLMCSLLLLYPPLLGILLLAACSNISPPPLLHFDSYSVALLHLNHLTAVANCRLQPPLVSPQFQFLITFTWSSLPLLLELLSLLHQSWDPVISILPCMPSLLTLCYSNPPHQPQQPHHHSLSFLSACITTSTDLFSNHTLLLTPHLLESSLLTPYQLLASYCRTEKNTAPWVEFIVE